MNISEMATKGFKNENPCDVVETLIKYGRECSPDVQETKWLLYSAMVRYLKFLQEQNPEDDKVCKIDSIAILIINAGHKVNEDEKSGLDIIFEEYKDGQKLVNNWTKYKASEYYDAFKLQSFSIQRQAMTSCAADLLKLTEEYKTRVKINKRKTETERIIKTEELKDETSSKAPEGSFIFAF